VLVASSDIALTLIHVLTERSITNIATPAFTREAAGRVGASGIGRASIKVALTLIDV
jgi:hypothetical protein